MKKNILMYTERWCSGGIESLLVNIINQINKEKFNIKILTSQKETNIYDDILKKNNCNIEEILKNKYKNPIIRTLKNLILFRKNIEKYKVDVIHINIYNSVGLIYAYIAKKIGIEKIIVHAHNTGIDNDLLKIKLLAHSLCKKIFLRKKYIYMACSKEASQFCFGNKNAILLHNGIDTQQYDYKEDIRKKYRQEFNIENKIVIGNVARFVKQKNHNFLIEIFKEIQKLEKNTVLVLVGKGELENKINEKVKKYNLQDKVIFLKERNDISDLMQMMDIFCLPSLYEGLGIVLIEAQATGLPCVVSENIPNEAIVTTNNEKILLEESPTKWAMSIMKLSKIRRESQIKNITKSGYNIKDSVHKLEKIY